MDRNGESYSMLTLSEIVTLSLKIQVIDSIASVAPNTIIPV